MMLDTITNILNKQFLKTIYYHHTLYRTIPRPFGGESLE